jgi:hypothetical protein
MARLGAGLGFCPDHHCASSYALGQPLESVPTAYLATLSTTLERRRASVTVGAVRPRTASSGDYVAAALAAEPYDLMYLLKW